MHGDGKNMAAKFELEKPSVFEKRVLTSWASKNPKMSAHSIMHSRFHLSSPILIHVELSHAAKAC